MTAALEAAYGVVPAFDRMPATEAVAMMLPFGSGFSAEVCCMAGAACLAAATTLQGYLASRWRRDERGIVIPPRVCSHNFHEILFLIVGKHAILADDARVGEEDVQALVLGQRVVDDGLDLVFITSIELADMNIHGRVASVNLLLVSLQVSAVKVANVDGPGTALGVLVCGGTADAQRRVGA